MKPNLDQMMRELRRHAPRSLKSAYRRARDSFQWDEYRQHSYAQEGEDLVLARLLGPRSSGFYVDVGAHHPIRFSNTYLFYRAGWRGINCDAWPGSMKVFDQLRPRDINLETAVMRSPRPLNFYEFSEPALNTFSEELATRRVAEEGRMIIRTHTIRGRTLDDILSEHVPPTMEHDIDFLSVDVEGLDSEVLESSDWRRFRPKVVVAEVLGATLAEVATSDVGNILREVGYVPFAKTLNSSFFLENDFLNSAPHITRSVRL